jgi:hypothetical protein
MPQLTPEQRALWNAAMDELRPSGDQTAEQARAFAIESFRHICAFEGLPVPSVEAVEAEIERRRSIAA